MLSEPPASAPSPVRGLYVHVPFCFHKCHYCDFYSLVASPDTAEHWQRRFVERIGQELAWWRGHAELAFETVFIGGGTPTMLRLPHLAQLLATVAAQIPPGRLREWTVEANPETLNPDVAACLAAHGVGRVSMGAQSFDPALLARLDRQHAPAQVGRAVAACRQAGIDQISLDLIFAIPGQSVAQVQADLAQALALEPAHLSCYGLTYEPGTELHAQQQRGAVHAAPEATERAMYRAAIDALAQADFVHYEISNWARRGPPDRRCQHNLLYWTAANWLGLGPGAASHLDGRRWRNEPDIHAYLAPDGPAPVTDCERLPPQRRLGERLMVGLRLREGVPLDWLGRAMPEHDPRWSRARELEAMGMLERRDGRLRLTDAGLFVADSVLAELL